MLLDLRAERRPGLLGRSDTLALLEIYVEKAVKQLHIAVPIVTGPEGMGRSAVLHELLERSRNTGRTGGYGCVRSGLGQALIDATTSLAVSIKSLHPDVTCTTDLIAAAESFRDRSPDEATEEGFVSAIDHLLYALSAALPDVPRGYVLCVDDLQLANEGRVRVFLEGLIALSSTGAPIPVVLTSSVGLGVRNIPQGLDQLQLRPLTNADLADIAQRQGVIATPEVIRQIGDYVEGRPGRAIEIIERASAKGLVDAHTVRAVIAESKILGAERSAYADAERLAAQARTAPDPLKPTATEPEAEPVVEPAASETLAAIDNDAQSVVAESVVADAVHAESVVGLSLAESDGGDTETQLETAQVVSSDATSTDSTDLAPHIVGESRKTTSGFDRSLHGLHTDHEVTRSQVYLDGLEYVPVAVPSPTVDLAEHTIEPVEHFASTTSDLATTDVPVNIELELEPEAEVRPATVDVAAAPLPVRQGGATRFGRLVDPSPAVAQQPPQPISLSPTQRRVLTCVAEATANGGGIESVSVAFVKRSLGEVSRFGGAASPVGDAIAMLSASGLLVRTAESVSLTPFGLGHLATQPS